MVLPLHNFLGRTGPSYNLQHATQLCLPYFLAYTKQQKSYCNICCSTFFFYKHRPNGRRLRVFHANCLSIKCMLNKFLTTLVYFYRKKVFFKLIRWKVKTTFEHCLSQAQEADPLVYPTVCVCVCVPFCPGATIWPLRQTVFPQLL